MHCMATSTEVAHNESRSVTVIKHERFAVGRFARIIPAALVAFLRAIAAELLPGVTKISLGIAVCGHAPQPAEAEEGNAENCTHGFAPHCVLEIAVSNKYCDG